MLRVDKTSPVQKSLLIHTGCSCLKCIKIILDDTEMKEDFGFQVCKSDVGMRYGTSSICLITIFHRIHKISLKHILAVMF